MAWDGKKIGLLAVEALGVIIVAPFVVNIMPAAVTAIAVMGVTLTDVISIGVGIVAGSYVGEMLIK